MKIKLILIWLLFLQVISINSYSNSLEIDLTNEELLHAISIEFDTQTPTNLSFDVELSQDGINWFSIVCNVSSNGSSIAQLYHFTPSLTNKIRVISSDSSINVNDFVTHLKWYNVILLEAEDAVITNYQTYYWDIETDSSDYNSEYVVGYTGAGTQDTFALKFDFTLEEMGDYKIWIRSRHDNNNANSYFMKLDDGDYTYLSFQAIPRMYWYQIQLDTDSLAAGKHTLYIATREPGAKIDKVCITSDDIPFLSVQRRINQNHNGVYFEAECAFDGGDWKVESDASASLSNYIESDGVTSFSPSDTSALTFEFDVTEAGDYYVWARLISPNGGSNSYWVKMNNDAWQNWSEGYFSNWQWRKVLNNSYTLSSGRHQFSIHYREAGTKLDKIYIAPVTACDPNNLGGPSVNCGLRCTVGGTCITGDDCTFNNIYDSYCNCQSELKPDLDNDGVCDELDQCQGFDDNLDSDLDNIPDDCDICANVDGIQAALFYGMDQQAENNSDTIIDATSNSYGLLGDALSQTPKLINGAVYHSLTSWDFSNTDNYIQVISNQATQKLGDIAQTDGLAIGFWVNFEGTSTNESIAALGNTFDISKTADNIEISLANNTYLISSNSSDNIVNNEWRHLMLTFDFTQSTENLVLYLDGEPITSQSINSVNTFQSLNDLIIGADATGDNSFSGKIDNFIVFDDVFCQQDVFKLYEEGVYSFIDLATYAYEAPSKIGGFDYLTQEYVNSNDTLLGERKVSYDYSGANTIHHAPPVGIHPRLFFGRNEIPEIINRLTTLKSGQEAFKEIHAYTTLIHVGNSNYNHAADYASDECGNARVQRFDRYGLNEIYYQLIAEEPNVVQTMSAILKVRLAGVMATEAFECLIKIEQDKLFPGEGHGFDDDTGLSYQQRAEMLATAMTYIASELVDDPRINGAYTYIGSASMAVAYDLCFNFMTPEQRKVVRTAISKALPESPAHGMNTSPEYTISNFMGLFTYHLIMNMSVEGEPGYKPLFTEQYLKVWHNHFTYGWYSSGTPYEGMGKNYQMLVTLITMAKRGWSFLGHPSVKSYGQNFLPHTMVSNGYNWQSTDEWGGTNKKFDPWDAIGLKWAYPDDPGIDFVWRNYISHINNNDTGEVCPYTYARFAPVGIRQNNLVPAAVFALDFQEGDWETQNEAALGGELSYFCPERGLASMRSGFSQDDAWLWFHCRQNIGGHTYADRNTFVFNALGRNFMRYRIGNYFNDSEFHSVPLIDDLGMAYYADECCGQYRKSPHKAPGRILDFKEEEKMVKVSGDATFAYNWKIKAHSTLYEEAFTPLEGWEPVTETPNYFRFKPSYEYQNNLSYYEYPNWGAGRERRYGLMKQPWNLMEKVYRTVSLVRADKPYVLMTDDLKKDSLNHNFKWVAQMVEDLELDTTLTDVNLDINDWRCDVILKDEQGRRLLVRVIQNDAYSNSNTPPAYLDKTTYNISRLIIEADGVIEPNFKVMLFPHMAGDALPKTTWNANQTELTVEINGDVETFEFPDVNGRTDIVFKRDCTVGDPCDDGNACTPNDQINEYCECEGGEIVELGALADALVKGGGDADNNFGTGTTLGAKTGSYNLTREIYLQFDVSQLPQDNLQRVKLSLLSSTNGPIEHQLYFVVDDNWSETGITWNNKPSETKFLSSYTVPPLGERTSIDITNVIQQELKSDGIVSLKIISNSGSYATYRSRNNAEEQAPKLILTYSTIEMDSDEDGVCDLEDICPGGDDKVDTDTNGIPDDCDDDCVLNSLADAIGLNAGIHTFDFGNGPFRAYINEEGWMLWLQYHHTAGTNPDLNSIPIGSNLPKYDESGLGIDNSTNISKWGHGSQALAASIPDKNIRLRWYGETSAHNRIIHFESAINGDFKSNTNESFTPLATSYSLMNDHTAYLPNSIDDGFEDKGDYALTDFPFYMTGNHHWAIKGLGNRWEVDDSSGNTSNTIHRVWIKSDASSDFEDLDKDGICDDEDICADGDDRFDSDYDGIPDDCEEKCILYSLSDANGLNEGIYDFDFGNGLFSAYVDENGWILWLQYHHESGTNPLLNVIQNGNDLPIYDSSGLGTNNSLDFTKWGHGSQAFASTIPDTSIYLRWYAETSGHNRIIHFESEELGDFQGNTPNSFLTIKDNFIPAADHTAFVPASVTSGFNDKSDFALTDFPFWGNGGHWGIRGLGNRWEVDDYNQNNHTIHRVWVKGNDDSQILDSDNNGVCDNTCIDIQLQAYLEGAYDTNTNQMTNALQSRGLLPGQTPVSPLATPTPAGQPYSIAPWNYAGTEGTNWTNADYTGNETDWILVSFRTGITKDTEVAQAVALLMKDGVIELVNRCVLSLSISDSLYIVLQHRNHIGVMTPQPVEIVNGILTYDFRTSDTYRDPTSFGQKQLPNGEWAMFAGDANQMDFPSFDVNGTDKTEWFNSNGVFDYYLSPDFNLDGDVNGQDKSLWFDNNGISSRVPK